MSRTGFIQNELDLKLLVLYIMARAAAPITAEQNRGSRNVVFTSCLYPRVRPMAAQFNTHTARAKVTFPITRPYTPQLSLSNIT